MFILKNSGMDYFAKKSKYDRTALKVIKENIIYTFSGKYVTSFKKTHLYSYT